MRLYNFNDVIGNVSSVSIIQQSLKNGTFPHIAIFSGMHGTGKSTCAEIASLYLTCDHPQDGNPCLGCPQCLNSIKALQNTGVSNRISKINVGRINKKADMEDLIKNIFDLKISDQNVVYIIEEAHALNDEQQTALLEEIDRLSENVYIIFCTTRPTRILQELRSRAINFSFNRLNNSEASVLFELYCRKINVTVTDNEIKDMILRYAKGIPRNIVNLIDFICSNEFENKTIAEFLGIIEEDSFLLLFEAMKGEDFTTMLNVLDDLLGKHTRDLFIEQLKTFILNVLFFIEGGIVDPFNVGEMERVHNVFDNTDVLQIAGLIEAIKYNATESEIRFKLLKLRQLLLTGSSSVKPIISNTHSVAHKQSVLAQQIGTAQETYTQQAKNSNSLQKLDIEFLTNLK